jgi:hypothetical protein
LSMRLFLVTDAQQQFSLTEQPRLTLRCRVTVITVMEFEHFKKCITYLNIDIV